MAESKINQMIKGEGYPAVRTIEMKEFITDTAKHIREEVNKALDESLRIMKLQDEGQDIAEEKQGLESQFICRWLGLIERYDKAHGLLGNVKKVHLTIR